MRVVIPSALKVTLGQSRRHRKTSWLSPDLIRGSDSGHLCAAVPLQMAGSSPGHDVWGQRCNSTFRALGITSTGDAEPLLQQLFDTDQFDEREAAVSIIVDEHVEVAGGSAALRTVDPKR